MLKWTIIPKLYCQMELAMNYKMTWVPVQCTIIKKNSVMNVITLAIPKQSLNMWILNNEK